MSSVRGHRAHNITTRSSPRRGRNAAHSTSIPVPGLNRSRAVASTGRSTQNTTSTTRQPHQSHTSVSASLLNHRNTVPSVSSQSVRQNSLAVVQEVDLTCNPPHQTSRRAQPPVVLGGGTRWRAPATRSKPAAQQSLRKRPTAAPSAVVAVTPPKKLRSFQDLMCPVCFDDLDLTSTGTEKPVFSTNCGHLFCKPCILACLEKNGSCPICRKLQTSKDVHPIYVNEKF